MSLTLSEIDAQLVVLRNARGSGVRRTTHGDTTMEFGSDADLVAAIAALERQRALLVGGEPRRGVNYTFQSGKGL